MNHLLSATIALAALPLSATSALAGPVVPLNGIAAKVNGMVITHTELNRHLAQIANELRTRFPGLGQPFEDALRTKRKEVLEDLIDNKLVISKLEEIEAKLPDVVIDEEVDRIVRETFNGSEAAFRDHLKKVGMTRRAFRESQREMILVQIFKQQQFKEVAPATDEEIKAHFNKVRNEMRDRSQDKITYQKIFIPARDRNNPAATQEEQLALADKLAAQVKGGADFATIAIEHSAGAFAADGGLWEDQPRPDLEVGFGDIIFDTREGQIVGPLKDPAGFMIVKVIKKSYGPAPSFDKDMKKRMRREVEIERKASRYDEWLKILKDRAMIQRNI